MHCEKDREDAVNVSIEFDFCSRGCQPDLLVVLQFKAATLFSTATSQFCTLFCQLDRSCTLHTSYLGCRCLILAVLLGEDAGLRSDPPCDKSLSFIS